MEIRLIANDQLVGYKLLIESPIAFIDSNSDGLVSVLELDTSIAGLQKESDLIAKSQPSLAEKYGADIASASNAIDNGDIVGAYQKIKQVHNDQIANTKQTKTNQVCLSIAVVSGILLLAASLFLPLRRLKKSKQSVDMMPNVPAIAVGQPKRVESQEGDFEQARKTPEQILTPKIKQNVNPAPEIICSNCGNVGLPKDRFCRKCGNPLK